MSTWNKKRRVMRQYDQSARVYDAQYREEQKAKIQTAIEGLALNKDSIILDAGCGTGLLFEHLAEKTKFIVGTDISRKLVKEATKKREASRAAEREIALILADADSLPFSNKTFDAVFAITLLQNTPKPLMTLSEIKRVSTTSATIVVTGLRKAFREAEFLKILERSSLKVVILQLDKHLREYIAVCTKCATNPKFRPSQRR